MMNMLMMMKGHSKGASSDLSSWYLPPSSDRKKPKESRKKKGQKEDEDEEPEGSDKEQGGRRPPEGGRRPHTQIPQKSPHQNPQKRQDLLSTPQR